jgi:integrase
MSCIRQTPAGSWQAIIKWKGVKPYSKVFKTKAWAERWALAQEREIEGRLATTGLVTKPLPPAPPPISPRLASILGRYVREKTPEKRGIQPERSRLEMFRIYFGAVPWDQMTVERIEDWIKARRQQVSDDTVRRDLALLSAVMETAIVSWGLPGKNLAQIAGTRLTKGRTMQQKVRRTRRFLPGEYRRLLRGLRHNPRMRKILRFALETGLRRKELIKITAAELRPDGVLIIDDKMHKTTLIPISSKARRILAQFPNGFGLRPDSLSQAFERACTREGITDLRVHDIRHEAISRFFEKGLSIEEVASITRHDDWRSLKIYTQPSPGRVSRKLG